MRLIKGFLNGQTRKISYKRIQSWYASLSKPAENNPPYNHIVQVGDPVLRAKADAIPIEHLKSSEVQLFLKHMGKVFKKFDCVGLSAPQIGMPLQIFIMEFNQKHMKSISKTERELWEVSLVPFTVVMNPEIKITDFKKLNYPEACQSVKGFYADVPRYLALELSGFDAEGNPLKLQASGWTARIIQHEMDHLNGRLYTDIMDRKTLTCSCWEIINQRRGKVELPYGSV